MSAYVEIIFDNSDGRFPTGNNEVVLRRTIGLKKDEYSLDRKNSTRSDVMNLLETAGFSRQNPYYIVPQGRVTHITNMKDNERLNLLKSVAGTQAFVAKKDESQKILNETNNRIRAIDAAFAQINDRLSELEEEQAELRKFQEHDAEKRAIEWILDQRELEAANNELQRIEDRRAGRMENADAMRDAFSEGEDNLARIAQQLETLQQNIKVAQLEKKQLEDERRERARAKAQAELQVRNLSAGQTTVQRTRQQQQENLQQVRQQIEEVQRELNDDVLPQYAEASRNAEAQRARLNEAETRQQRLFAKQGRSARFRSKRERDEWLNNQINETNVSLSRFRATRMQTQEGIAEDRETIERLESDLRSLRERIDNQASTTRDLERQLQEAKEKKDELMDERKELWRSDQRLDGELASAQEQLRRAERVLSHMMDGNTSRGLEAVRRIKQQQNLEGCYGTLAELIDAPQHQIAIEAVAGSSLFHYVVDTDETATRLVEQLNRERSGRVTFMPLNRLRPKTAQFPTATDVRPLTSLMKYDPKFEKAVQQVFGKSIICQNLTVASQYARTHGLSAVTPEGDRSDKKGALSGGYIDQRSSRLKATRAVVEARAKYEELKARSESIKRDVEVMNQRVTRAESQVQKLERELMMDQNSQGPARQELQSKTTQLARKREDLEAKEKQESIIAQNMQNLNNQQQVYQAERQSAFRATLTPAEQAELDTLTSTVQELRQEYNTLAAALAEVETRKSELETRLNANLQPQLALLESQSAEIGQENSTALDARQKELDRITKITDGIERSLAEVGSRLEEHQTSLATLQLEEQEARQRQEALAVGIEKHQRGLEKAQQSRTIIQQRRQEILDTIREHGVVPEEQRSRFRNVDSKRLTKQLQTLQTSLKQFEASGLNRYAVEHYRRSQKTREELQARRAELDKSQKAIEDLIQTLDQRKDEAIERTFRQVSKAFTQVFSKLVPQGSGRLIIQRRADRRAGEEEESEEDRDRSSVEAYTGVGISVSFNSRHDDQQRIQQLSGGQKSKLVVQRRFTLANTMYRSVRSRINFCNSRDRPGSLLHLRRNRR